jgi:hypothetical protein
VPSFDGETSSFEEGRQKAKSRARQERQGLGEEQDGLGKPWDGHGMERRALGIQCRPRSFPRQARG